MSSEFPERRVARVSSGPTGWRRTRVWFLALAASLSVLVGNAFGTAAYITSSTGEPWGSASNTTIMSNVFGSYTTYYMSTAGSTPFTAGHTVIFLEGSQLNALEMESYIAAYQSNMETYVSNGGAMLINSGPNEGSGMSMGFGVTLTYSAFSGSVTQASPGHAIFAGPFTPVASTLSGSYYGHATVSGGLTPLLTGDTGGTVLGELAWGSGVALFGGMTMTSFHSPSPDGDNVRANMLDYLAGGVYVSNSAPVAYSQSVTVGEDTTATIVVTATDADGDALTYTLASSPTSGVLTGTLPTVTYSPDLDFYGADSFTFYVSDGTATSSTATVSVTVNGTPVPTAQDMTMLTGATTDIVLSAEDPEGDAITYTVMSTPATGTLSGTSPNFTFTPAGVGFESLTFTASDAYTTSAVTSIDVTTVDPVVLSGVDLMVNGGFETGGTAGWTVVDDSWLGNTGEGGVSPIEGSYFIDAGTVSSELEQVVDVSGYTSQISAGTMTIGLSAYARSKSELKPDSARVIVEHRASDNSTVLYSYDTGWFKNTGSWRQVTDVTTPPTGTEFIAVRLLADRSGTNMDAFFDNVELFADGIAEVATFDGIDDYIEVADSASLTVTNEVTMEAWVYPTGAGSDPTYGGVIISKDGEYQLGRGPTGDLWANFGNTSPGWSVVSSGYTIPTDQWTHVAASYEAVYGVVTFYANGSAVATSSGSGVIGDHIPSANSVYIGGRPGGAEAFEGQIDEPRVWTIERPAEHLANSYQRQHDGDESGLAGYWPFDGAVLTDYTANANDGVSNGAGASIGYPLGFISNAAPTLSSIASQSTDAGVGITIALSASDSDGDSLTVDVSTEPTGGTVTIDNTAGTATYTPVLGTSGTDSFALVANDGVATSTPVTVTVSVTAHDYAPVVGGLVTLVSDDFQNGVTGSWTDTTTATAPADGTRGFLGQFGNGTVSLPITGIPSHTEVTISFDLYLLNSWDGNGGAGHDRVTITADATTLLDTTFSNVTNGSDNSQQSYPASYLGAYYTARQGASEANTLGGTFYGDSVYNFTYTFAHTASTLQFDFSASGLEDVSNESWGLDNVVVTTQHLNIEEDVVTSFTLPGSDAAGEALTYAITTQPTNGTISVAGAVATYTPTTYYNGTDTLGYTVSDATTTTSEATISILIDPLDSAPILDAIPDVTVDEDSGTATVTLTGIGPAGMGDEDSQTVTIQATSFAPSSSQVTPRL